MQQGGRTRLSPSAQHEAVWAAGGGQSLGQRDWVVSEGVPQVRPPGEADLVVLKRCLSYLQHRLCLAVQQRGRSPAGRHYPEATATARAGGRRLWQSSPIVEGRWVFQEAGGGAEIGAEGRDNNNSNNNSGNDNGNEHDHDRGRGRAEARAAASAGGRPHGASRKPAPANKAAAAATPNETAAQNGDQAARQSADWAGRRELRRQRRSEVESKANRVESKANRVESKANRVESAPERAATARPLRRGLEAGAAVGAAVGAVRAGTRDERWRQRRQDRWSVRSARSHE